MPETLIVLSNAAHPLEDIARRLGAHRTFGLGEDVSSWAAGRWTPTHYCCVDDEVLDRSSEAILALTLSGRIQSAVLGDRFFTLHPELRGDARFVRAADFDAGPGPATDASIAVRYGASLGVSVVALADLADGAPSRIDTGFDRLLVASLRSTRDDFHRRGLPIRLVACDRSTALARSGVLPYLELHRALGETLLSAVVTPCHAGEIDQIEANLALWAHPSHTPYLGAVPSSRPELVFVFNNDGARDQAGRLTEAVERHGLGRMFSRVRTEFLELTGDRDVYARSYDRPPGAEGYKAGPNNQFFETMTLMSGVGRYAFYMEADCAPIRPDWLRRLGEIVDQSEPFWIMGSAYRGVDRLARNLARHINGNAIYAVGDPSFVRFVEEVWRPALEAILAREDRRLAYDCALEVMFSQGDSAAEGDPTTAVWRSAAHMLRYTAAIQNIAGRADRIAANRATIRRILRSSPDTLIVHSHAAAEAVRRFDGSPSAVLEMQSVPPAPATEPERAFDGFHFVSATGSPSVERAAGAFVIPTGDKSHKVTCVFAGRVRPGDMVTARLELRVAQPGALIVTLFRQGDGEWESANKRVAVEAGRNVVEVSHRFAHAHPGARLQVKAAGAPATVWIESAALRLEA